MYESYFKELDGCDDTLFCGTICYKRWNIIPLTFHFIRSIWIPESRSWWGQEVVLPHERGWRWRNLAARWRGRIRCRHEQEDGKAFRLLRQKTEVYFNADRKGYIIRLISFIVFVGVSYLRPLKSGQSSSFRCSASCLKLFHLYSSTKRPERLISKLKTMNLEDAARGGKKMIVARQPKGPDGSKGFKAVRKVA